MEGKRNRKTKKVFLRDLKVFQSGRLEKKKIGQCTPGSARHRGNNHNNGPRTNETMIIYLAHHAAPPTTPQGDYFAGRRVVGSSVDGPSVSVAGVCAG